MRLFSEEHLKSREQFEERVVRSIGKDFGYGQVMHLCQKLWRESLEAKGMAGGEFAIGPCVASLVDCPCIRIGAKQYRFISSQPPHCDWCCGSRCVTKRVAEAMEKYLLMAEAIT
jgi:hypothetical protein